MQLHQHALDILHEAGHGFALNRLVVVDDLTIMMRGRYLSTTSPQLAGAGPNEYAPEVMARIAVAGIVAERCREAYEAGRDAVYVVGHAMRDLEGFLVTPRSESDLKKLKDIRRKHTIDLVAIITELACGGLYDMASRVDEACLLALSDRIHAKGSVTFDGGREFAELLGIVPPRSKVN